MEVAFVFGVNLFYKNELVEELPNDKNFILVFFETVDFSYQNALCIIREHNNISALIDIKNFFLKLGDDMFSYGLGDGTIHITKNKNEIFVNFTSYQTNLDTLEDFIKTFPIDSMFFQIRYSKLNLNILISHLNKLFWPIILINIFIFITLGFKLKQPEVDLENKKLLAKIIFDVDC